MDQEIDPDGDYQQEPRASGGKGKLIGGCLVLLLLAAIGIGYLVMKAPQILRYAGAKTVTMVVATMVDESLQLPEEERAAVMAPVERLGDRVVDGEVEPELAMAALGEALQSNEAAVVALHSFESRYVDSDLVPADQREAALLTANRFSSGLLDRRIPRSYLEPLADIVIEERPGEDGAHEHRLKEELSAEDVNGALVIMRQAVEQHRITDDYQERSPAELSAMVDRAIERALVEVERSGGSDGPAGSTPAGTEPAPAPTTAPRRNEEDLGPAL